MTDYEVGKKKPPKATRFKKGQSGNPNGRPKGSISFANKIEAMLREAVKDKNGQEKEMADVIVQSLIKQAAMGNMKAIEYLIDKVDGKAKQSLEIETIHKVDKEQLKRVAQAIIDESN